MRARGSSSDPEPSGCARARPAAAAVRRSLPQLNVQHGCAGVCRWVDGGVDGSMGSVSGRPQSKHLASILLRTVSHKSMAPPAVALG